MRQTRGRGLPGWGSGVTPPISTMPGPRARRAEGISPCLSRPADMPIGLESV